MERRDSFTAQEFIDKLRRDELDPPLKITGIVKLSEDSSAQLMFTAGTRCADWTPVPLDAIESVEAHDVVLCADHRHPLVTLTFKTPQSSEGAMFAALLRGARKRSSVVARVVEPLHGGAPTTMRARFGHRPGAFTGSESFVARGCATVCPPTYVDETGTQHLYSCRDVGGGVYICYYK